LGTYIRAYNGSAWNRVSTEMCESSRVNLLIFIQSKPSRTT